jgi:hypothetical protein
MGGRFAARIEQGTVTQVIVGDVAWAEVRLPGRWVGSDVLVGVGWSWTDGEGFRSPQPFPSWQWEDGWVAPVPQPEGDWVWDEDAGGWVGVMDDGGLG